MSNNLVKSFNELPRKRTAPSGKIPNVWYFDLRYVHIEPTPSHVLYFLQPHSEFMHMERLPLGIPSQSSGVAFFPESGKEAAPEVAKAILHAFVNNITDPLKMDRPVPPAFAPWNLITEDKDLAVEVGKEFKRLGVRHEEVCKIGLSTASNNLQAQTSFTNFFNILKQSVGFTGLALIAISTPQSIMFHNFKLDQPLASDNDDIQVILKYTQQLSNARPPMTIESDSQSFSTKMMSEMQLVENLLNSKPVSMVKAEADNGNPESAIDYGLRLFLGVRCKANRTLARNYLVKALSSERSSDTVKSTAHSVLIDWYISSCKNDFRIRYMYAACHHANQAVSIGRRVSPAGAPASPAVLWFMSREFNTLCDQVPDLILFFKDAWQAMQTRDEQMEQGRMKMQAKRMKKPNRYRCAAVGCGVEADSGHMLSRCKWLSVLETFVEANAYIVYLTTGSGQCDPDKKPYYCSKECQKADWKNHKPFCKAGAECSVMDVGGEVHLGKTGPPSKKGAIQIPIQMPDGTTTYISSSTMDSKTLKEMRDYAASSNRPGLPDSFRVELERIL